MDVWSDGVAAVCHRGDDGGAPTSVSAVRGGPTRLHQADGDPIGWRSRQFLLSGRELELLRSIWGVASD
jgi:hypothetical protein